jgi:hypothetical protein
MIMGGFNFFEQCLLGLPCHILATIDLAQSKVLHSMPSVACEPQTQPHGLTHRNTVIRIRGQTKVQS